MPNIEKPVPNSFCWAELATTDAKRAKSFYTELFGWSTLENPMPDGTSYTILTKNGRQVAGLSQMGSQYPKGTPSHWGNYVAVSNLDATVQKVTAEGGKLVAPPFDVMEHGRMATFTDPTGGTLSLWQPKQHQGFGVMREEGAPCWFELISGNVERARDFYTRVFGWTYKLSPEYSEIVLGGESIGGVMQMRSEMQLPMSSWFIYYEVKNCAESVERAKRLGAKVFMPPQDVPDTGIFAVLQDPTGATFDLIELNSRKS